MVDHERSEAFSLLLTRKKYPLREMERFRNSDFPQAYSLVTAADVCLNFSRITEDDQDFIRQTTGGSFDVQNIESFLLEHGYPPEKLDALTWNDILVFCRRFPGAEQAARRSSDGKPTGNPYRKKNISARMFEKIAADTDTGECYGWNTTEWAQYFGCSVPAVTGSKKYPNKAWCALKLLHRANKANLPRDRHGRDLPKEERDHRG